MTLDNDLIETIILIEQWANWCRVKYPQGHCGSAEWKYRAPSDIDKLHASRPQAALPDILAVDDAWRALPERNKQFLSLHYVKKRPREKTCRALAIRNHDDAWRNIHRESVVMLRNRIMFVNKVFL